MEMFFKEITEVIANLMEGIAVLFITIGGIEVSFHTLWPLFCVENLRWAYGGRRG